MVITFSSVLEDISRGFLARQGLALVQNLARCGEGGDSCRGFLARQDLAGDGGGDDRGVACVRKFLNLDRLLLQVLGSNCAV